MPDFTRRPISKERFSQRMDMADVADLLLSTMDECGYIKLHNAYPKAVGPEAAVLLAYLMDLYYYFDREYDMVDDWFFRLVSVIEEDTGYSVKAQSRCVKVLVNAGYIETKRKGRPPKRYFRLRKENLTEVLIKHRQEQKEAKRKRIAAKKAKEASKKPKVAGSGQYYKAARNGDY